MPVTTMSEQPRPSPAERDTDALIDAVEPSEAGSFALPNPSTSLVGRAGEIERVGALVDDPEVRLVTLTGPGGIGKTRLALAVARRANVRDRAGFVSLAEVSDPALIPATILRALGLETLPNRPVIDILAASLRDRAALLVLDNFEHLLDGATVASELLAACPDLTVLATSRVRLGLSGERVIVVDPLSLPAGGNTAGVEAVAGSGAVQLFVERARSAFAPFELTQANAADVAFICSRFDGLPLAIELAAARAAHLSPHALADRLRRQLSLLDRGPRDAVPRHQTMRAAVMWSVDLLSPRARECWTWFGVWEGGFTLERAEALAAELGSDAGDVEGAVDELMRHGLIRSVASGIGEPRFTMLETTRELAVEHLERSDDRDRVREAHAQVMLEFSRLAQPGLEGTEQAAWYYRVLADVANIRAAFRWDLDRENLTRAMEGVGRLSWFWTDPGFLDEGWNLMEEMSARNDARVPLEIRGQVLSAMGMLATWREDNATAYRLAIDAISVWQQVGDDTKTMEVMLTLARSKLDDGEMDEAVSWLEQGFDMARRLSDPWYVGGFANLRGSLETKRGDYATALRWHQVALQGWRDAGYRAHSAMALEGLGRAWMLMREFDRAVESFDAALEIHQDGEPNIDAAFVLAEVAVILARTSQASDATRLMSNAVRLRQDLGLRFTPGLQARADEAIETLRATLEPAMFARAWNEGRALAYQDAVSLGRRALAAYPGQGSVLTQREREVLALMVNGVSDEEIASRLFISRRTASKHVGAILEKLDAPNRTAAVTIAYRRGLV